jgi:murein DD-endopeptidase MepM/ murein hydrolase activator NlpD
MAGCCPPAPPSNAISGAFGDANGHETDIRPGESVECYMARAGNTTGLQDDATENVPDKIENASIPLKVTATAVTVNVQFKLTAGSPRTPTSWTLTPLPAGLAFTTAGHLTGAFTGTGTFTVTVTALDGAGTIDSRVYTLGVKPGDETTQIQLISPLPGSVVNSKFGPRMHPIQKVMKPHTGIDMKFQDRSVGPVLAAADGEIVLAGGNPSTGYGVRVWIKHLSGSGNHLCTTTYNHLSRTLVSTGQKVMAGQKIGIEGSTGASTGNHLHFECRLPDGKFIDPLPLIRGTTQVAAKTLSNGDPDPDQMASETSDASLSEAESTARQAGCQAFGPAYPPSNPAETVDPYSPPVSPSTDPFEQAWFFTMTAETGQWTAASESDADVIAGAIGTSAQRKKCGYVSLPNFPGGETKFGIAQKYNPKTVVKTATYAEAKKTGWNNYWRSAKMPCANYAALVSVILLDMNFLHGDGNTKTIFTRAGISAPPSLTYGQQLLACEALTAARIAFIQGIKNQTYSKGWLKRANDNLAYVKSLPPF